MESISVGLYGDITINWKSAFQNKRLTLLLTPSIVMTQEEYRSDVINS